MVILVNLLSAAIDKSPEFLPGSLWLVPSPRYLPNFIYCVTAYAMQGASVFGGTPPAVAWLRNTPSVIEQKSRLPVLLGVIGVPPATKALFSGAPKFSPVARN